MDKNARIAKHKENLRKATALHHLYSSSEFQEYLLGHLQQLATVEHIDPTKFSNREEYLFQLDNKNKEAQVYGEFLKFMQSQEGIMSSISKEIKKLDLEYEQ